MKVLKAFAVEGKLFSEGDEIPESLVTSDMIESGKVQGLSGTDRLLVEDPSPAVKVTVEAEEEPQETTAQAEEKEEGSAEEGSEEKPKGRKSSKSRKN